PSGNPRPEARPGREDAASARHSSRTLKAQIGRDPAFARGLLPITRHRVDIPGQAPVVGSLGHPAELGRARKMTQGPRAIIGDVADETEFREWLEDTRYRGDRCILHEASFPVAALRPGIWVDQIDSRKGSRRQPRQ